MELGKALEGVRPTSEAKRAYYRALELRPGWHDAECGLAGTLGLSHYEESIELYRKCRPYVQPQLADINFIVAVVAAGQKTLNAARQDVASHPGSWEAHAWLAQILVMSDQQEESRREQQIAAELRKASSAE